MKTDETTRYDVIVIGAGSAGLTAAVGFSKIGKKVLLIEKEHMGGECTNSGCIPSKALLYRAKAYFAAKSIAGESSATENYRADALAYVRGKIEEVRAEEEPERFEKTGIHVVRGEAIFETPCALRVGGERFGFTTAIIATGSTPRMVSIPGLEQSDILTNQNVFVLTEIPAKLLILGSGPIGMELGQAFAMLGSAVTIVTTQSRLAALEDESISPIIQKKFESLGVRMLLVSALVGVEGRVGIVETRGAGGAKETVRVAFDKLLMAVGRVPNIPKGLEAAGILSDERAILTDSQYRTSNKDVYAIGDAASASKFTHMADDAARQVVARIASKKLFRVDNKKSIPRVIYTSPEIASVGLTNAQACAKYDCEEILRLEVPYSANDRAKTDSATDGLMVLVVRRLNGAILGANIVGAAAGELISIFTVAIDRKISLWKLRNIIYPYPTYSLLIKRAGDLFFAETVANLKNDIRYGIRKHAPKLAALLFWGALLYFFQEYRSAHDLSFKEMLVKLALAATTTAWGPFVYMLAYAIRPLIFFPATLLTALSGALFGLPLGILYTVLGENASANFAYAIGRFFGKGLKLEDSFIGNRVDALRKRPFESILFMRLFYVPFDLTNYGAGILRVPWGSYALATLIGIMPGLVTFVALGAGIKDIRTFELTARSFDFANLAIAVAVFAASLFLSHALQRWHAKKEESKSEE